MKISTQEAVIKTASVEIKSLTVSGKQVTLAMFRQLQEEALVSTETAELAGVPWGRINYHFDCKDAKEHLHVVWQKGTELRRSIVLARWEYTWEGQRLSYRICLLRSLARSLEDSRIVTHYWTKVADIKREIKNMGDDFPSDDPREIEMQAKHLKGFVAEKESCWGQQYESLKSLDQLFIAV